MLVWNPLRLRAEADQQWECDPLGEKPKGALHLEMIAYLDVEA